jgi:chaperone required for assembly of F1-ATPase
MKRFWTEAAVAAEDTGWSVRLDDRPLRTPARAPLLLPTAALAEAVAAEWQRQEERVRPDEMPMTRLANTALDRVEREFAAVARIVADFGETDLLCYRAAAPPELAARQAAAWDPLLDWAEDVLGARLVPTTGVIPVDQPGDALDRLRAEVLAGSVWRLTALHELVSLGGSLVIGLAVERGVVTPTEGWAHSRIDEEWQAAQWGRDDEADATADRRRRAFEDAAAFLRLAKPSG